MRAKGRKGSSEIGNYRRAVQWNRKMEFVVESETGIDGPSIDESVVSRI